MSKSLREIVEARRRAEREAVRQQDPDAWPEEELEGDGSGEALPEATEYEPVEDE